MQEARIIRIFKRKAHLYLDHVPRDDDDLQWLALMQHHGAPTRLLDFTWSPYIAAFFALEMATRDAAVYAVDTGILAASPHATVNLRQRGVFQREVLARSTTSVFQSEPGVMNRRLTAQLGTFLVPGVIDDPAEDVLDRAYPERSSSSSSKSRLGTLR